jgi:hypothetical protein
MNSRLCWKVVTRAIAILYGGIALFIELGGTSQAAITSPLSIYAGNAHYFSNNGLPVVIVGAGQPLPGANSNAVDPCAEDIREAASNTCNYMRFWTQPTWDSLDYHWPWARLTSGSLANDHGYKYDLTKWDNTFWSQLTSTISQAQEQNIYVEIMLWDEVAIKGGTNNWYNNPFNPDNNINGLNITNGANSAATSSQFYDLSNSGLLALQESYVNELASMTSGYPNVVYLICNEYSNTASSAWTWESHWSSYLRNTIGCSNMILVNHYQNDTNTPESQYWGLTGSSSSVNMVTFHLARSHVTGGWSSDYASATHNYTYSFYNSSKAVGYDETPEKDGDIITNLDCRQMVWGTFTAGGHVHIENGLNVHGSYRAVKGLNGLLSATGARFWQMQPNAVVPQSGPGNSSDDVVYSLANTGTASPQYIIYFTEHTLDPTYAGSIVITLPSGPNYQAMAYTPATYQFTDLNVGARQSDGSYTISGIPENPYSNSDDSSGDMVVYVYASQNFVKGQIALQYWSATGVGTNYIDAPGTPEGVIGTIQISTTSGVVLETHPIVLDSAGNYRTVTNVPDGNYYVGANCSHWLRWDLPATILEGGAVVDFTGINPLNNQNGLLNGDVNGDNYVEDQDYSLLGVAWYSQYGDDNWDIRADLNGDGYVEDQDYSITGDAWYLSGDFGQPQGNGMHVAKGCEPLPPCWGPNKFRRPNDW